MSRYIFIVGLALAMLASGAVGYAAGAVIVDNGDAVHVLDHAKHAVTCEEGRPRVRHRLNLAGGNPLPARAELFCVKPVKLTVPKL
jgi:hypothetical protein